MNDKQSGDLDPIERRLITLLQADGRATIRELSQKTGVTEVTVRRKLRHLLGERIVQIVAAIDPFDIGYESPVIIGLRVERSRVDQVAERICQHRSVRYVAAATGNYDLIVEVISKSNHDLSDFLLGFLNTIEGVLSTDTSLILRIYKQSWEWDVEGNTRTETTP